MFSSNPHFSIFSFENFKRVRWSKLQSIITVVVLTLVNILYPGLERVWKSLYYLLVRDNWSDERNGLLEQIVWESDSKTRLNFSYLMHTIIIKSYPVNFFWILFPTKAVIKILFFVLYFKNSSLEFVRQKHNQGSKSWSLRRVYMPFKKASSRVNIKLDKVSSNSLSISHYFRNIICYLWQNLSVIMWKT